LKNFSAMHDKQRRASNLMTLPRRAANTIDLSPIREGLAELPRADNVTPGQTITLGQVYTPQSHRNALDPERTLVIGNRGMGKSFWAHALNVLEIRELAAQVYRQPRLRDTLARIGFDGSESADPVAPNKAEIAEARQRGIDPQDIWRTVIFRAVRRTNERFLDHAAWTGSNRVEHAHRLTEADDQLTHQNKRVLVMFDALDVLGDDWEETRNLTRGLLRQALASRSYRAIRVKLFMRSDQFEDDELFNFPDASKITNDRVTLEWPFEQLYGLLSHHLRGSETARECFARLGRSMGVTNDRDPSRLGDILDPDAQKRLIDQIAGEYMGAGAKRGRVYSWVPLHLADAKGQTSPRTFLTAWREAAGHGTLPKDGRAVDHLGINEGVRRASQDRLRELKEDYRWISEVLEPLRGELVPLDKNQLALRWEKERTFARLLERSRTDPKSAPITLRTQSVDDLLKILQAIGVVEIRPNGKINVPDIFRVEAGIKRKGGVKPPVRQAAG
jgi:hypothetical protein